MMMADKTADQHETKRMRSIKSKTTGDHGRITSRFEESAPAEVPSYSQAQVLGTIVVTVGVLGVLGLGAFWFLSASGNASKMGDTQTSAWGALTQLLKPNRGNNDSLGPSVEKPQSALMFASPDSSKQLTLVDKDHALFTIRGVDMKGGYTTDASTIVITPDQQSITYTYTKMRAGLVDQDGSVLYAEDAPEMLVIAKMKLLATTANRFFRASGQYPNRIEQLLQGEAQLAYKNPFTGNNTVPVKRSLLGFDDQSVDMNLNDFSNMQNAVRQLSIWSGQRSAPGTVEFYRDPSGAEGDTLIIRGSDRSGQLLHSSKPGLSYMITCAGGRAREQ